MREQKQQTRVALAPRTVWRTPPSVTIARAAKKTATVPVTIAAAHSVEVASMDDAHPRRRQRSQRKVLTDVHDMRRQEGNQFRWKGDRLQDDGDRDQQREAVEQPYRAIAGDPGLMTTASRTEEVAKTIAAKADRPPNAASGQKRIRIRAALPRPARGRSRGRRGAPVIALVVVPVIARVIVLVAVEVDAIQHHADRSRLSRAAASPARVLHGLGASSRNQRRRRPLRRAPR